MSNGIEPEKITVYLSNGTTRDYALTRIDGTTPPIEPPIDPPIEPPIEPPPGEISTKIATNLCGVGPSSPEFPFNDLQKMTGRWRTQAPGNNNTGEFWKLDLDEHGWVKSLPAPNDRNTEYRTVSTNIQVMAPQIGNYILSYEGDGDIRLNGNWSIVSHDPAAKNMIVRINGTGNLTYTITRINPNDHLRNIKILPIDYKSEDGTFNPDFIDYLSYGGSMRFMDWGQTNNSKLANWEDRNKLTYNYRAGVPVEVCCQLANTRNTKPWFCIPHLATDDFVRQLAECIKENLRSDLDFFIEYSNECWNWNFDQAKYCDGKAKELGLRNMHVYYSKRAVECFQIFDQVFGEDSDRVCGILCGQSSNTSTINQILDYRLWGGISGNHAGYGVDAIGLAPYFGGYMSQSKNRAIVTSWLREPDGGLGKVFKEIFEGGEIRENGALRPAIGQMTNYIDIAKENQLFCCVYEGGQHLTSSNFNDDRITELYSNANLDPRMGEAYQVYLQEWFERGGDEHAIFTDTTAQSKFGSWGIGRSIYHKDDVKYQAVKNFISSFSL